MTANLKTVSGYLTAARASLEKALTDAMDPGGFLDGLDNPAVLLAGGRQDFKPSSVTLRLEKLVAGSTSAELNAEFAAYVYAPPADANCPTPVAAPEDIVAMLFSWLRRRPFVVENDAYTDVRLHSLAGPIEAEIEEYDPELGSVAYTLTWGVIMPTMDCLGRETGGAQSWAGVCIDYNIRAYLGGELAWTETIEADRPFVPSVKA